MVCSKGNNFLEAKIHRDRMRKAFKFRNMTSLYFPFFFPYFRLFLVVAMVAIGVLDQPMAALAQTSSVIDVNSADAATLATLPGITPTEAKRIIKGRPYHALEDLKQVKGLTDAKVEALLGHVAFGTNIVIQAGAAGTNSVTTAPRSKSAVDKVGPGEKININRASIAELTRLPGIGQAKAQAIVDYRTQNGAFKAVEDIEKVKGIKNGLFTKLKDYIEISD